MKLKEIMIVPDHYFLDVSLKVFFKSCLYFGRIKSLSILTSTCNMFSQLQQWNSLKKKGLDSSQEMSWENKINLKDYGCHTVLRKQTRNATQIIMETEQSTIFSQNCIGLLPHT